MRTGDNEIIKVTFDSAHLEFRCVRADGEIELINLHKSSNIIKDYKNSNV